MASVTLDDVAARAGVSRMTASNALRGKTVAGDPDRPLVKPATAARVRKAAAELGYRPNLAARRLSSGRTGIIGLSVADLDMIFPAALAATLSDEAYRRGFQLVTQQTRMSADYEREMLGSASAQVCDGTIVCWPTRDTVAALASMRGHPTVVLDGFGLDGDAGVGDDGGAGANTDANTDADRPLDRVFTPCVAGARAAVRHLVAAGARRILLLGTSYREPTALAGAANSAELRLRGACEALREAELPYGPDLVRPCGWTRRSGYDAMTRILAECGIAASGVSVDGCRVDDAAADDGRNASDECCVADAVADGRRGVDVASRLGFDAVFCMADTVAIGALKALTDAGVRVPDDVMVMGFDGVEDGRYTNPGLSSVAIDVGEIARVCLDMLADRIGSGDGRVAASRAHTLAYRIVARGSAERNRS
ncbi:Periplasmic binding protein-like domain-containing protein [Bifidobacterium ramosum]|uniref:LacI family DNA-binding transcriptional regulator n=1 Tax=Bifidobacterium ramosum TaxID=1798158 RepID=A0A6L4WY78_9BIFI|nr:LacI family DNA-binding transcriptional regulator [Bifidobacterium ramosum]KAB8287219.1 Periplasmic binding protein-like domain-containing protein [Bifidobacterium ramosum]NEG71932.1 LacI family DNA-binding transcriptional regulator [Bifidobacterium ramosum]